MSLQSLLEPFSKLLSFVIQNAVFTLAYLVELCGLCYRAFTKVTMRLYLPLGTNENRTDKVLLPSSSMFVSKDEIGVKFQTCQQF